MPEKMPPGLGLRVAASAVVFFGWLIFLVVFLAFYAGNFSFLRNLAIVLVSVLVGIVILIPMWIQWGMRYGQRYERERERPPRKRSWVEWIVFLGWLIFLIFFLWFYAGGYNVYQNIAVFIASILVACIILAPVWLWRMKGELGRARKSRPSRGPRRRKE